MKSNRTKNSGKFVALAAGALAAGLTLGAAATTYHVDRATGNDNDDGELWSTAFKTVRKALLEAGQNPGPHEIFVVAGTYYPDEINGGDSNDRGDTFSLLNGVSVYGGFLNGDAFEDRDPETNITILSGDIDQNDGPHFANTDGNSTNVVTAEDVDSSSVLDGFLITAGNADLDCPPPGCPGGSGPSLMGGGMLIRNASPIVDRCAIEFNQASDLGGGMVIINGSPAVIRSTFTRNLVLFHGGGAIHIGGDAQPILVNCEFRANQAPEGGVIHTGDAGAAGATLVNCLVAGNMATGHGGAIDHGASGELTLINCTITNNLASQGGAIFLERAAHTTVINSILWANDPNQIVIQDGSADLTYSCIEDCGVLCDDPNDNNIPDDPLFVDAANGDYRLTILSLCIDAGNNADVPCDEFDVNDDGITCDENDPEFDQPTPDLDLFHRVLDGDDNNEAIVDMGSYEFIHPNSCPWDLDGNCDVGIGDLLIVLADWGNPYGIGDLLALLAAWGPCPPCSVEPLSFEEELADACLTMDHWNAFVAVMSNPNASQEDKDRYNCWMIHYLFHCDNCSCEHLPECPSPDPFN